MDRTGNRVPISGNIISVTRPTASGEHRPPRRVTPSRSGRKFRAIVRPAKRDGKHLVRSQGKRVGKKVTDSHPRSLFAAGIDVSFRHRRFANVGIRLRNKPHRPCERYFNSRSLLCILSEWKRALFFYNFLKIQLIIPFVWYQFNIILSQRNSIEVRRNMYTSCMEIYFSRLILSNSRLKISLTNGLIFKDIVCYNIYRQFR